MDDTRPGPYHHGMETNPFMNTIHPFTELDRAFFQRVVHRLIPAELSHRDPEAFIAWFRRPRRASFAIQQGPKRSSRSMSWIIRSAC